MNRRIGERRLKPRFEVVGGELWGRLETTVSLALENVGIRGALVYSPVPLAPASTHLVTTDVEGAREQLRVRVTRCEPVSDRVGGFRIGLEFLTLSARMRAHVEEWVASGGLSEPTA